MADESENKVSQESAAVGEGKQSSASVDGAKQTSSAVDGANQYSIAVLQMAAKLIENEASEEVLKLKNLMLRRIAMESDIKPSRIPAPLNITEIGGYLNLLATLDKQQQQQKTQYQTMLSQTLASILGLPMQSSIE